MRANVTKYIGITAGIVGFIAAVKNRCQSTFNSYISRNVL